MRIDGANVRMATVTYDDVSLDPRVRVLLDKQKILWIAGPLMMYEQTAHLTLRNLALLGQVVQGSLHFEKDRTKYLMKLHDIDKNKITEDGDRVWPANTDAGDHVQAMFEVVEQAGDDIQAARSGSALSAFSDVDELVNGLKGHEAGGVKQKDIENIVAICRDKKMLTLPGSDTCRPGKTILTTFKFALDPKDKPGSTTVSPRLSWPTLGLSSVDNEAGQVMLKENSDVAAVAAAYEAFHFGALEIGHDLSVPAGWASYASFEDGGGNPMKVVDEDSVKMHLQVLRDAARLGGFDATRLRYALESFNNTELRVVVNGGENQFVSKLCPGAALRSTVVQFRNALENAKVASIKVAGLPAGKAGAVGGAGAAGAQTVGEKRRADEWEVDPKRAALRQARREVQEGIAQVWDVGKGKGKVKGKGGKYGGGKGQGAWALVPCRDFQRGYCNQLGACPNGRAHVPAGGAGYPLPPNFPLMQPPPQYGTLPPGVLPFPALMPPKPAGK